MQTSRTRGLKGVLLSLLIALTVAPTALAAIGVQCPGDTNQDAIIDIPDYTRQLRCQHLSAGDGFTTMSDGRDQYIFGFAKATGLLPNQVVVDTKEKMEWPAPTIVADEGDEFYLTLSNVGMNIRPDLFDPHSVHWHGFPQAASVFDGLPESSFGINMFSSLTYYYNVTKPGTYMYHCHIEAVEHMQMGMLGNLYVRPAQNRLPDGSDLNGFSHSNPDWNINPNLDDPLVGTKYAYNDGDGSTRYDVEFPIMMGGFDPDFHDADETVQPLPFAAMEDKYIMFNGRGYPDTVDTGDILNKNDYPAQQLNAKITATAGQRVLIRLINLNITHFWTVSIAGIPMEIIARDSDLLRSEATGENLFYMTNTVTLGGGENIDIILDTTGIEPGTYVMYCTNLNLLSTPTEDYGGMMTEIEIQ